MLVTRVITVLMALLFVFANTELQAETKTFEIKSAKLIINGGANTGSWDCESPDAEGSVRVSEEGNELSRLRMNAPVKAFDCGRSQMTDNMHDYMKADEHPDVRFRLNRAEKAGNNAYKFYGMLTVAGVTQSVVIDVEVNNTGNGLTASGTHELKMTDFDIDPPRAMMGTVRARDEVEVEFEFVFR